jgi:hypothetical protein
MEGLWSSPLYAVLPVLLLAVIWTEGRSATPARRAASTQSGLRWLQFGQRNFFALGSSPRQVERRSACPIKSGCT